ncbi:MAG TPA: hypothetical protein VG992_01240 [Candidatus Saccharimonadales bacterium]|nr:hypothetical protein [Candidatus Saccharimonadales bacterium]
MIQFNLLPDVKLAYLKAERSRRLVMSISAAVTAAALILLLLLFSINQLQKKHLADLNRDITTESKKLEQEPQLNKILTVQNQLESLTNMHNTKPAAKRLFTYLNQVTPSKVDISSFNVDFTQHTVTITGTADTLTTVDLYVDTLKFTTYSADNSSQQKAFSSVVLSSFDLSSKQNSGQQANYTITFAYNPEIFDITKTVNLVVPNKVTTRSEVDQPTDLFNLPESGGGN